MDTVVTWEVKISDCVYILMILCLDTSDVLGGVSMEQHFIR